jgi:acyl-CoA dehydrogenase
VEGANILTRTLIIYGQGAIRCHPWVLEEIQSAEANDLARFDRAFFGHIGFTISRGVRAYLMGLTGARFTRPGLAGALDTELGRFSRLSAAFAVASDAAMASLGSSLKRREMLSGRLADVLAWMYLGSATVKRFVNEGQRPEDLPLARWATWLSLYNAQEALAGFLDNHPNRAVGRLLRYLLFPWGRKLHAPTDAMTLEAAEAVLFGAPGRERLSPDVYVPDRDAPGLGFLEDAYRLVLAAAPAEDKLRAARRSGRLPAGDEEALLEEGLRAGIVSAEEHRMIREARAARYEAIQVDAFPPRTAQIGELALH